MGEDLSVTLGAVRQHILERLEARGRRGDKPPFGLRKRAEKALVDDALAELVVERGVVAIARGKHTCYALPGPPVEPEPLLENLLDARYRGRTRLALTRAFDALEVELMPTLRDLEAEGRVEAIEVRGKERWVHDRFAPPNLERVSERLAELLRAHPGRLFNIADLRRPLSRKAKVFVAESVYWLEAEGVLRRVYQSVRRSGRERRREFFMLDDRASQADDDAEDVEDVEALVDDTYRALREDAHTDFVELAALLAASGLDLDTLHAHLLERLEDGRAQVTGTNLSVLDAASRAAAITWRGERCALITLTTGG